MPEIQAFRGIRYDLGHVGSLSDVVAPPYDVIGPQLQEELYRKHPCNVVRLILNRQEPGDDDEVNNRYSRAKRFFKNWQDQGVLFHEAHPAIYVYHQEFSAAGQTFVRRGFMARMRLEPFGQGQVFPHEETMPGPILDRLMLTVVCKANLSPIFGLYPDPQSEPQNLLEQAVAGQTPIAATDHLGVTHRLWPVIDPQVIGAAAGLMGPKPIFIADGHHRYTTALKYRDQIYDSGALRPDHPARFVLMMCIAMDDPGLLVMPTHRLFRGVPAMTAEELAAKLGPHFTTRPAGQGPEQAATVWEDLETGNDQGTLGLYTQADHRWTIARITAAGRARMAEAAEDHTPEWQQLGVAILHRLLVENLMGCKELPKPTYVHLVDEAVAGLAAGEYPLAALVMPATVEHIRTISIGGERMPAKSTYFYPKLLSGLVINPLE
jgi:uncharacterized protein (DUF1015 family)